MSSKNEEVDLKKRVRKIGRTSLKFLGNVKGDLPWYAAGRGRCGAGGGMEGGRDEGVKHLPWKKISRGMEERERHESKRRRVNPRRIQSSVEVSAKRECKRQIGFTTLLTAAD